MLNKGYRLGILGGTFDPVHYGHLLAAEAAYQDFELDQVFFIPNRVSPHKLNDKVTPPELRCEMLERAIVGNSHFTLSRLEIDRNGPSYTVDTLNELKNCYPDAELFFITGSDVLSHITSWHQPAEVLSLAHWIGVSRPGFEAGELIEHLSRQYPMARGVHWMDIPHLDISSTVIRKRVEEGQSIRYLLPDPVWQLINEKELYTPR